MKPRRILSAARLSLPFATALVALFTAQAARAASQIWDGGSVTNGNWGNLDNWNGAVPGATSGATSADIATFDAAIANTWGSTALIPIVINSTTQNIAGISFATNAGSYFIGSTAGNKLILSNSGTIQILSTLAGTGKTMTINAPIQLTPASTTTAGTYTFSNNATDSSNTLVFSGTISASTTSNTQTLNLRGTNTGTNTVGGIISNGSATTFNLTKFDAGTWILSGNNSYTGITRINTGTLQVNTGGTLGNNANQLFIGNGVVGTPAASSVGNLTLNTSVTVGALTVRSNTTDTTTAGNIGLLSIAAGRTLTASSFTAGIAATAAGATNTALSTGPAGAGGNLTINGAMVISPESTVDSPNSNAVVDFSGLNTLTVNGSGTTLAVGSGLRNTGRLILANVANTLIATTFEIGDSGSANAGNASSVVLGAGTNVIQTTNLNIGAGKAAGSISFAGAPGTVSIRGLTGGASTATIIIGDSSAGTYTGGTNSLLLAGHNATVQAGSVVLSRKNSASAAGGSATSNVTFDTGTFTASTILMAGSTATADAGSSGIMTGTFTVGGATANSAATGVVNIGGNLLLANLLSTTSLATGVGTLTINGGTVNVNTAAAATNGIFDTSVVGAGASTTTLNLQGGTLNLNGGVIGGTTGTGKRNITNLNFKSGTLQNVLQINDGTGGLTKSTDGTGGGGILTLSGTNSFTGGLTINAGTVQLGSAGALRTTAGSENAVTFGSASTGTLALTGRNTVVSALNTNATPGTTFVQNANGSSVANATLTVGNSTNAASTFAGTIQDGTGGGTLALTKAGTNTLTLSGTNSYSGATTVAAGTLKFGAANVIPDASAVTVGGGATAGTLDIAGFSDTLGTGPSAVMLALGASTTTVGGLQNQVINSGGSAVLTVDGGLDYRAGTAGFHNGKALISANLQMGVAVTNRNFNVADSSATAVDLEITGVVSNGSLNNPISKEGTGTLYLNNEANTFTGQAILNNGTTQVTKLANSGAPSSLGTGSSSSVIRLGDTQNPTLEYVGATDSSTNRRFVIGTATGASTAATILNNGVGKLTFSDTAFFNNTVTTNTGHSTTGQTLFLGGSNTLANTISGTIRDNAGTVGNTIAVTKQDAGTWILDGTNDYTGATSVNAGTLEVALGGSIAAGSAVTVSNSGSALVVNGTVNGTLLANVSTTISGTGTVNGAATINGIHAPGNSPGIQTFTNGLTYGSTATLNAEFAGNTLGIRGSDFDGVDVTGGTLMIDSLATLALYTSSIDYADTTWDSARDFTVIDFSGAGSSTGSFLLDTTNAGSFASEGSWSLANTSSDILLSWTPIPEPSVTALIGALGGILLLRRRR